MFTLGAAYHESGHALVARRLGLPIEYVAIGPDGSGIMQSVRSTPEQRTPEQLERELTVLLAGDIAATYAPAAPTNLDALAHATENGGGPDPSAGFVEPMGREDSPSDDEALELFEEELGSEAVERCRSLAVEFVDRDHLLGRLETVADALFLHRVLTAEDLEAGATLSPVPRFTFREWREQFRMMRDKSYRVTRLGPEVVDYLTWKRLSRASERTLDQYERDLRLVCLAVSTGVEGVTHGDLMLVLETVPEKSWKRVRAAWGDFFKRAVREGRRPDNPVERLPKLRPTPEPVYDLWKQEELDLLVAGTRKMESPLRERFRVLTMIESGARAGELRAIQLGDFDLYRKTLTVTGKGRKRRLIPVSSELTAAVDEYLLTEYVLLERAPVSTDFLWVRRLPDGRPRHRAQARAPALLPRLLRLVETRRVCRWREAPKAAHDPPHLRNGRSRRYRRRPIRGERASRALLHTRDGGLPAFVPDENGRGRRGSL